MAHLYTSSYKSDSPVFDPTTSLPLEVESKNVFTAHHFMELVSIFPKDDLTSLTRTIHHVIDDWKELTAEWVETW